jgi:hypothetical protein
MKDFARATSLFPDEQPAALRLTSDNQQATSLIPDA